MGSHGLSLLEALGSGLLQGVALVFPISGLGHGVLIGALPGGAGTDLAPAGARYLYAVLRLATAAALVAYYWRDWVRVLRGLGSAVVRRAGHQEERRWAALLVLAAVPGCLGAALLTARARPLLDRPRLAAVALLGNGIVMLMTWLWWRRSPRAGGMSGSHRAPLSRGGQSEAFAAELSTLRPVHALVLGVMPLGSLVPGLSGVALTLCAALLLGLTHEQAAHVTLLLLAPFLVTRGLADLPRLSAPEYDAVRGHLIVAALAALVAAYAAAVLLARYFRRASLRPFAFYCVAAGAVALAALTLT